jgi:CarD family transcriptional regulator
MWSRRAQEYDAKINSGDLISIAEVVRDLYRAENQPEQSYSERQLYEAALDRMAREIAAVNKMSETEAVRLVETNLSKGPKRGAKADNEETETEQEEAGCNSKGAATESLDGWREILTRRRRKIGSAGWTTQQSEA